MARCLFSLMIFSVLLFASCSKNDTSIDKQQNPVLLSVSSQAQNANFVISQDILNEYLYVTKRFSNVENIVPLVEEGDTLVYFIKYNKGWEVISADSRIGSVLAKSESSEKLSLDQSYLCDKFASILDYVRGVKHHNSAIENQMWSYLKLRVGSRNDVGTKSSTNARGIVAGMWREVEQDPQYTEDVSTIPHIITARWNQTVPWNGSMPKNTQLTRFSVGCGPVAVGQVIHHYRKQNSKNIAIPQVATDSDSLGYFPAFSSFSSLHWNSLAMDCGASSTQTTYTAVFLSYLAQQMRGVDTISNSAVTANEMKNALDLFQLDYTESALYDYENIYNNLYDGKPVIVGSEFDIYKGNEIFEESYHYYIIDRYSVHTTYLITTYEWVPDYRPTEWELQTLPQWRFEDSFADGKDVFDVLIRSSEDTYFGMNWGGYADEMYLVRSYTCSSEDEAGTFPYNETIYTPLWIIETNTYDPNGKQITYRASNIKSVFYDIEDN